MPTLHTITFRRVAAAALAGAMLMSLLPAATMGATADAPKVVRQAEWKVLAEINRYRASRGLAPLRMAHNARLAARERSRDMRNYRYLSHSSPTGRDAASLLSRRGVRYMAGAENIGAVTLFDWGAAVRGVVSGWKGSTSHRQAILSREFNYIGIGAAGNGRAAWFSAILLRQLDHTAPKAGMVAAASGRFVAAAGGSRNVTVKWWGRDRVLQVGTAGIKGFTVQYKRVGGEWRTVRRNTLARSLTTNLSRGEHKFRVRAMDRRGNIGRWQRPLTVTVN